MKLLLALSIFLQVAAVGVRVPARDLWVAIRRPAWIARTVLAMFVAVPILAVVLAKTFEIPVVMKAAMLLMAISAAAPLLPGKLLKLGVEPARDASLAAVTTVFAIVLVPLEVRLLSSIFVPTRPLHRAPWRRSLRHHSSCRSRSGWG